MTESDKPGFHLAFATTGTSSKQKRKIDFGDNDHGPRKERVMAIGKDGIHTEEDLRSETKKTRVIPRQENTFRIPGSSKFERDSKPNEQYLVGPRKLKPSFIPEESMTESLGGDHQKNGIERFETSAHDTAVAQEKVTYGLITRNKEKEQDKEGVPAHLEEADTQAGYQDRELAALRKDLEHLPPEARLEDYEAMPVEHFGEALLRGMGWTEEKGIGRNKKGSVPKISEPVRRPHRLGLGAAPPSTENNKEKGNKQRPDELRSDIDAHKIGKEKGSNKNVREERTGRSTKKSAAKLEHEIDSEEKMEKDDHAYPWLVPGIRVKIVDKRLDKGRIYLKKGTVVDVKAPGICDVWIQSMRRSVFDVRQRQLETVVPRTPGVRIRVVAGRFKGQSGNILQRNVDAGVAAVHLDDDDVVRKLPLDDIAEWVGIDHDA